jgi:hypothetical protein
MAEAGQAHKGHHKAKSGAKADKRKDYLKRKDEQAEKAASKSSSKNSKVRKLCWRFGVKRNDIPREHVFARMHRAMFAGIWCFQVGSFAKDCAAQPRSLAPP